MDQTPQINEPSAPVSQQPTAAAAQPARQEKELNFLLPGADERSKLEAQFKAGSGWFYWIAGLSLLNSVILFAGGSWRFIFGLGVTQLMDEIVRVANLGTAGQVIALLFALAMAALFGVFGYLSGKKMRWPFITGMVFYLLDGLLLLLLGGYLAAAVHAYVLYRMFSGLTAVRKLG